MTNLRNFIITKSLQIVSISEMLQRLVSIENAFQEGKIIGAVFNFIEDLIYMRAAGQEVPSGHSELRDFKKQLCDLCAIVGDELNSLADFSDIATFKLHLK